MLCLIFEKFEEKSKGKKIKKKSKRKKNFHILLQTHFTYINFWI